MPRTELGPLAKAVALPALDPALDPSARSSGAAVVATGAAIWHWDLASGRVEWGEGLRALFGYQERVTDAAWRQDRIHPDDRQRVEISLQKATIVNHGAGAEWSEQYRFRQADGSYVAVLDRAYVIADEAGPRRVLGVITLRSGRRPGTGTGVIRSRSPASGPSAPERPRG